MDGMGDHSIDDIGRGMRGQASMRMQRGLSAVLQDRQLPDQSSDLRIDCSSDNRHGKEGSRYNVCSCSCSRPLSSLCSYPAARFPVPKAYVLEVSSQIMR